MMPISCAVRDAVAAGQVRLLEIAAMLGVSAERARQLELRPDFPSHVTTISRSRFLNRDDIEAWIDKVDWWKSKPWRRPST